jgi:hypothetical protein
MGGDRSLWHGKAFARLELLFEISFAFSRGRFALQRASIENRKNPKKKWG